MVEEIKVPLPGREYVISIGSGLLAQAGPILAKVAPPGRRVLIVTNPVVAGWYLDPLRKSLETAGFHPCEALVPEGEEYKSLGEADRLYTAAAAARLDRTDVIAALGGGVIGDLAGFAAATYLRGVSLMQIPTTLLAQVDSSAGGKTAINLPAGKNLVGAFHQPRLVLADLETLDTLPERELRAGLIEVLKMALLRTEDRFAWYETHLGSLLAREPQALTRVIADSCRIKAEIVIADERELGERALLNLGHTAGHALEKVAGYGALRHGEAVGFGLLVAARLSRLRGVLSVDAEARVAAMVRQTLGQVPRCPADRIGSVLAAMRHDKKAVADRVRFILLHGLGRARLEGEIAMDLVRQAMLELEEDRT